MYDRDNDVERLFNEESRSKKRDGYGAMKRKATRGTSRKSIKFPSDYLSAKEKKKLNGEIMVSSIYKDINKIPQWEEIKNMEEDKIYDLLKTVRSLHTGASLQKYWGIRPATHYALLEKIGLHIPKVKDKVVSKRKNAMYKNIEEVPSYDEFLDMDLGGRIELLTQLKKDISMSALKRHWQISQGTLYTHLYKYGVLEYKGGSDKMKKAIENVDSQIKEDTVVGPTVEETVEEVAGETVEEVAEETVEEQVHIIPVSYENEVVSEIRVPTSNENKIIINNIDSSENFDLNIKSNNCSRIDIENRLFRTLMSLDFDKNYDFEFKVKRR